MSLDATLRSDLALAALEVALIERARALYQAGFTPGNLRASQMAAAGERILGATSFETALASLRGWLDGQLEKLRAEVARGAAKRSWLLPPGGGAGAATLGEELVRWIEHEVYLGGSAPPALDRLAALRRFWDRLHDLYRYEAAAGEPMPLRALAHQEPGGTSQ